jgi:hypothetical protein
MVPDLGACWCNSLPPWDDLEFKDWRGVALRMLQEHTTIAVSNAPRKRIPTATAKRANTFTGRTKTLREASREQVEAFVIHLADWAAGSFFFFSLSFC